MRPAYLVAGQEFLRVQELCDALRAKARSEGYTEREVFDIDDRFDWDSLRAALASMSLFASRRLFELRLPTGKPGKEGGKVLEELLSAAIPDTVLLIVCHDWSAKHGGKWSQALERDRSLLWLRPLSDRDLPAWLRARLEKAGLQADAAAIGVLVERVEGNLLAAAQEIDKLALLHPGARLDAGAMAAAVADSARYNVFGLMDAAIAGDAKRVVRVLAGLRAEGEAVPGLMGWVTLEIRRLAGLAAVAAAGGNLAQAMRSAGVWSSRTGEYQSLLRRHPAPVWEALAIECGRIDRMSKGREPGDAWLALERALVAMAQPRAAALLPA